MTRLLGLPNSYLLFYGVKALGRSHCLPKDGNAKCAEWLNISL